MPRPCAGLGYFAVTNFSSRSSRSIIRFGYESKGTRSLAHYIIALARRPTYICHSVRACGCRFGPTEIKLLWKRRLFFQSNSLISFRLLLHQRICPAPLDYVVKNQQIHSKGQFTVDMLQLLHCDTNAIYQYLSLHRWFHDLLQDVIELTRRAEERVQSELFAADHTPER